MRGSHAPGPLLRSQVSCRPEPTSAQPRDKRHVGTSLRDGAPVREEVVVIGAESAAGGTNTPLLGAKEERGGQSALIRDRAVYTVREEL